MSEPRESAYVCGCDPGVGKHGHWCEAYPHCAYGKAHQESAQAALKRVEEETRGRIQRLNIMAEGQARASVPSPDTFVDVATAYAVTQHDRQEAETKRVQHQTIPTAAAERKLYPITTGVLDYFPLALLEVARVSYHGNEQHNPGQKLHWARGKSTDQEDCLVRHLMQRGTLDTDGMRHSAKVAWRALALLQLELEQEGK